MSSASLRACRSASDSSSSSHSKSPPSAVSSSAARLDGDAVRAGHDRLVELETFGAGVDHGDGGAVGGDGGQHGALTGARRRGDGRLGAGALGGGLRRGLLPGGRLRGGRCRVRPSPSWPAWRPRRWSGEPGYRRRPSSSAWGCSRRLLPVLAGRRALRFLPVLGSFPGGPSGPRAAAPVRRPGQGEVPADRRGVWPLDGQGIPPGWRATGWGSLIVTTCRAVFHRPGSAVLAPTRRSACSGGVITLRGASAAKGLG